MHTKKISLVIVTVLVTILTSCYWKNWDTINAGPGGPTVTPCTVALDSILYNGVKINRPSSAIDTGTIMSYSIDIAPIINASCATGSSCHGAGAPLGKDYTVFSSLYSDCRHDTTGSTLFSYISPGATDPMPKTGAKLSTCDRNKIRNWIHQGAQNN